MTSDTRANVLPTGTVTFLLTDVEGSTRAWERDAPAMTDAMVRHDEILAAAITRHNGFRPTEQGEGDSIVAAFARASDAVAAALDSQRELGDGPLRVRMALHTGEAQVVDGSSYAGPTIIRTARLRAVAHGGQTLLSRACAEVVGDNLPQGSTLADLGSHRLKDLSRSEQVFQLVHPDLPDQFPPLRSLESVPNNLPPQLTSFVGRQRELADVRRALSEGRLVTLTGAGGCGKTRLAAQVAAEVANDYPGGCWWVELAALANPELVPVAALAAVGLREDPGRPPEVRLAEHLGTDAALLVLDNCEHLVDACASFVEAMLARCRALTVLVTSREPLGVGPETTWRVPPLELPPVDQHVVQQLSQYDAVRLFIERAKKVRPNFSITNESAPAVAEICARLDGIPLGIELAAARARHLTPDQIARALTDRFRLLTGGSRTGLARQQTLQASVEWSHQLLSEPEQRLFRRLSVFTGGFTLDAAEAVGAGDGIEPMEVLDLLGQLVDKSLVDVDDDAGSTGRYHMLESIRQYGRDRLLDAGEADAVLDRHLHFCVSLVESLEEGAQFAHLPVLDELDRERSNVRAALEWATSGPDRADQALRIVAALAIAWQLRGVYQEGLAWFDRALDTAQAAPTPLRCRALWGKSHLAWYANDVATGMVTAQQALDMARELGDDRLQARPMNVIGWLMSFLDVDQARAIGEQSLALARRDEDLWCVADDLQMLAYTWVYQDRHDEARSLLDEAYAIAPLVGNRYWVGWHGVAVGLGAYAKGQLEVGREVAAEGLAAGREVGEPSSQSLCLFVLTWVLVALGRVAEAREAFETAAESLHRAGGLLADVAFDGTLASVVTAEGDLEQGRMLLERSLAAVRSSGIAWSTASTALQVGNVCLASGDLPRAREAFEEAAGIAEHLGNDRLGAEAEIGLAAVVRCEGDVEAAEARLHRALAPLVEGGFLPAVANAFELLGALAADTESWVESARLLGVAGALRTEMGYVLGVPEQVRFEETYRIAREALGDDAFEAAWQEGCSLSLDDAVAYVSRARGERKRPSSGWSSLTPTEIQVVKLAAKGLTNPDIGDQLLMSRSTVKTHLAHVFTKLGVTTRAELAREATHRGL